MRRARSERSTHGRVKTREGSCFGAVGGERASVVGVNEGGEVVLVVMGGYQPHSLPSDSLRGEMRLADGEYHPCWSHDREGAKNLHQVH